MSTRSPAPTPDRDRQIVIFCPFVGWPLHFITDLEIIQRHLAAGDNVTVLVCDGELSACDVNIHHHARDCLACIATRSTGLELLSGSLTVKPLYGFAPKEISSFPLSTDFSSVAQLKRYRVDGFDIGDAAMSSLVRHLRDADFDLAEHSGLLQALLRTAYDVFASVSEYLRTNVVDRFYVFNSRFASTRGAMRACQRQGVECMVHERGCDIQHFHLYPNTFPHDREFVDADIRRHWHAAANPNNAELIATAWYRNKAVGIEGHLNSFVTGQHADLLPERWSAAERNIVIFTSSEDEFVAVGEGWENPLYASELEGVRAIVRSLRDVTHELRIWVRVHPNLTGIENRQTRGLRELNAPFLTVIPADSPVSTYAMLRNSEKVLTFGSTIGIEAVFWRVPSILAGMSFYRDMGGTYNPTSHVELMELLNASLVPKESDAALRYGYYQASFGIPFEYAEATGFIKGTFKGKGFDFW